MSGPASAGSASRLDGIVGPAPRVLPLNPQAAFVFSGGRRWLQRCSRSDVLAVAARGLLPFGRVGRDAQSVMVRCACAFRLRIRNLPAAIVSSETARGGSTTLAHSSSFRHGTGLCSPTPPETRAVAGVTRLAVGFLGAAPLWFRVAIRHRSPPDSRYRMTGEMRYSPREPVTSALA